MGEINCVLDEASPTFSVATAANDESPSRLDSFDSSSSALGASTSQVQPYGRIDLRNGDQMMDEARGLIPVYLDRVECESQCSIARTLRGTWMLCIADLTLIIMEYRIPTVHHGGK